MPPVAPLLTGARPDIIVDRQTRPRLGEGLLDLLVEETIEGLYRAEATFGNWGDAGGRTDFLYFGRDVLEFGKDFEIRREDSVLFKGKIYALEARFKEAEAPSITVLAEDVLQDFRMKRRTRSFEEQSDADVVRQIASDYGLSADVDLDGPAHKALVQLNQSDLAFLRERARALGAEVWVSDRTLSVKKRESREGEPVPLTYQNQLLEFRVIADLSGQATSWNVSGWDVAAKESVSEEATESAISAEASNGESGPAILNRAFGERKQWVAHAAPVATPEARASVDAWFKMSARRFVRGTGVALPARAPLRAGGRADISGLGPLFSGEYYVTAVQHRYDMAGGFRTEFTAERPWLGRAR
jgi:phage protein D